jgi:hypothetical protein
MNGIHRGQAALEFMMTYGWAILVVLAAIGALSYFGVLNPTKFTPETCMATSGFSCAGKPLIGSDNITFSVINGLGYKINLSSLPGDPASLTIFSATLESCDGAYFCDRGDMYCTNNWMSIQDGAGATVIAYGCDGMASLNAIKGEIKMQYKNPQSLLYESVIVTITGRIDN